MKKTTKIIIISMSVVIALLIAAVCMLLHSLNVAKAFASYNRNDIALGKYEILRDSNAAPQVFLQTAKAKDYDIIIFSEEQTLALGEKIKELFPNGNANNRRFTIGIEGVTPDKLATLFNDDSLLTFEFSRTEVYHGMIFDFYSEPAPSSAISPCTSDDSGDFIVKRISQECFDKLLTDIVQSWDFENTPGSKDL